jgi:hypothetical protein
MYIYDLFYLIILYISGGKMGRGEKPGEQAGDGLIGPLLSDAEQHPYIQGLAAL